jgi:hypothetical protein
MMDFNDLVDDERGLTNAGMYTDSDIYERELEYVFGRSWLFLAHDSQLPKPGSFIQTYMAEDPVLVGPSFDRRLSGPSVQPVRSRPTTARTGQRYSAPFAASKPARTSSTWGWVSAAKNAMSYGLPGLTNDVMAETAARGFYR